ncbi:hypothetical protein FB567DRAFT_339254 [Paraphoma chrysanthemicola]|uniref:F-box domain-containing protein n=1 Tax=Paraphoma chrysanthemicola TaxID=798071 RepID=A0A8K0VZU9_9PLEO|nr:hypothetical protein FB567DRAFT_339254 [Paraphoma chrysanthemicola]
MATDALIAAFRRLPTDSRQAAIGALVAELTPYEWRTLHGLTAARTFQFDIIGNLPVELVASVFAYLTPATPYHLQCVSRTWHRAMRSPDLLKRSLKPWISTAEIQGNKYSFYLQKAKHVQAFRRGEPVKAFNVTLDDPHGYIILVEDRLIWSCLSRHNGQCRAVYLFDINSWRLQKFNGDARETLRRLVASNQLIGFATNNNTVYVWDVDSGVKRTFRVPSASLFQAITCRERTIACAGCLEQYVMVYVWDFDSQLGTSFTIPYSSPLLAHPTPGRGLALLLQPNTKHIIVFADERCSRHTSHRAVDESSQALTTIRYNKFTYAGECVSESRVTLDGCAVSRLHSQNNRFTPVDRSGRFRLNMFDICVQFDENLHKFTEPHPTSHPGLLYAMASDFWWEDVFFESFIKDTTVQETPAALVHVGTGDKTYFNPLLEQLHRPQRQIPNPCSKEHI